MKVPLVIYHAHCLDGYGSAYSAYVHFILQKQIDVEFYPAVHGEPAPEVKGKVVYLVDFAYKRAVMKALCEQAEQVIVLDHHVSAMEDLKGLDSELDNVTLHWDMNRSGAMMAWEYFHSEPAPLLIRYIQDRDLWRWEFPESQDLNAGLMSKPFSFEFWHTVVTNNEIFERLIMDGKAINRYRNQLIVQHQKNTVMTDIAGYQVPVVNCPRAIVSELLGEIAKGHPFAAGYVDRGNQRAWSLRSTELGLNVAEIASLFGGGGHPRAAGFTTALQEDHLTLIVSSD